MTSERRNTAPAPLLGVAVLPDPALHRQLVTFAADQRRHLVGPQLKDDVNLPHLTLLQCPYDPATLTRGALLEIRDLVGAVDARAAFTGVSLKGGGWVFADLAVEEWLREAQSAALALTEHGIVQADIQPVDPALNTPAELASQDRYGYRHVGETFRPHVTIGMVPGHLTGLPTELSEAFERELANRVASFDRIVFYRAGTVGELLEVLAVAPLHSHRARR